ncbi:bifunctional hydroxymethylpyrimidine kinase/phosphomethylpyrimidine kinase [Campylobacter canadensis]|uniref:hydroxymethylpyrimidine kinase n=1 Tax=Campylobacter canadensis TaxID=449520 RepID=A0ABS7WUQ1_9BACT|nr:bifunctional hydroxymethylpyrimidine kinase/phosphomethylpyrimidine kinase [Campylobacter canadensis]MBZ7987654.1 bifunctional hydroxymethylpyrimidine kinase/phosphomethylpyrimidine kinase [Campylobacter canadensis]MBZ7995023.1 bifunctional hydroxymethylpyrimidine kinase/phosphomethylpyrimidine kinase [Campylobacter canadensis]MBZ7996965.1 bifunctional hydroxymethylpyrimidine kinase/phosphomethylpyrimidine kinase [Campylobacter canadensis]MBZ8000444.1 bifunctional hydroxymethylpyrimidine kin
MNAVLTIAGSDCSGGSGLEADLKTFTMHNTFGMVIVLSVVAVNTKGVYGFSQMSADIVQKQYDAVFGDIVPKALKTGLMGTSELIKISIDNFKKYKPQNVVIDPVMFAKSGARLINDEDFKLYKNEFIQYADILTPNKLESELICGFEINNLERLKDSAKKLIDLGAKSVIAKGGKYFDKALDYFYDGKDFYELEGKLLNTTNDHGAGCTLSAAIAANLANGMSKLDAVTKAKLYTQNAMEFAPNLGEGRGPLNHMFNLK